jgi:hypothetical protein
MEPIKSEPNPVLDHPKIKGWLEECRAKSTRRSYSARIKAFFEWYGKGVGEFLSLSPEEKRHVALQFQNEFLGTQGRKNNTISSIFGALNSFLDCYEMKIDFKGKIVRRQMDLDSHNFSNGDLTKMFELGNTKEKALISLAVSLGWEVSAVLGLPRKQLQSYIDRARSEKKQFFYFMSQRQKTGAPRLGVLNPLALEWCEKWLSQSEGTAPRKRKVDKQVRVLSDVFDITEEGANTLLRRLAKEAHLKTTGRVHFHKLRSWTMSGLSRAGFNEFQIKFLVGKSIPMTDSTYLFGFQEQIEERYPKAYEEYLNLQRPLKAVSDLTRSLEAKTKELEALNAKVLQLELRVANLKVEKEAEKKTASKAEVATSLKYYEEMKALMKKIEESQ